MSITGTLHYLDTYQLAFTLKCISLPRYAQFCKTI